jgi:splicing factor 3B subunit 5
MVRSPPFSHPIPPTNPYPTQADKLRAQQQLEQLQARYVGTGHADTTRYEWTSNVARDSLASYVGHAPLLEYMALGLGESREKVRAMLIDVRSSFLQALSPSHPFTENDPARWKAARSAGIDTMEDGLWGGQYQTTRDELQSIVAP